MRYDICEGAVGIAAGGCAWTGALETKLLRPAGYSLSQRWDDEIMNLLGTAVQAAAAGSGAGLASYVRVPLHWGLFTGQFSLAALIRHPRASVLLCVVLLWLGCLLGLIYCTFRLWQLHCAVEACRLGLRREQAVGESLHDPRLAAAGYRAFHDVPGDGKWNVDHVVVGPAGVFVLETKARSKRPGREGQAKHEVHFDGRTLQFPDWNDHETVRQVERNAEWVRKLLADFALEGLPVQPVVVVPGWYVVTKGIGVARPVSILVETFGTGDAAAAAAFAGRFDFRPAAITEQLDLTRPIFRRTTNYGHFGKAELSWER